MSKFDKYDYPDDLFKDTRMSFGDHIEDLRRHLLLAIYGFAICLGIGFVLDGIGSATGLPVGLGLPALELIKAPVEGAVQDFYDRRVWDIEDKLDPPPTDEERERRKKERERFATDRDLARKGDSGAIQRVNRLRTVQVTFDLKQLRDALADPKAETATIGLSFPPVDLSRQLNEASQILGKRMYLTTLSAQEAFVVYFKVSIICGIVLSSPWIFYQIWAFVAAGLYPHERHYVYSMLGPSIALFLIGVFFCQFAVLPGAVKGLLAFNAWIGLDPDLRLSEWLGFALVLPLVFGISFQTPLVMLFLARIGIFGADDYRRHWRYAFFFLAVFAAVITPTPDLITMSCLWVPMYGLYELGIVLVRWLVPEGGLAGDTLNSEEPVGV
jgi:sec-independent protein translocase protein TatC